MSVPGSAGEGVGLGGGGGARLRLHAVGYMAQTWTVVAQKLQCEASLTVRLSKGGGRARRSEGIPPVAVL